MPRQANILPARVLGYQTIQIGLAMHRAGEIIQAPTEPDLAVTEAFAAQCKRIRSELEAITPNPQTRNLHTCLTEAASTLTNMAATLTDLTAAAREYRAGNYTREIGKISALWGDLGGHFDSLLKLQDRIAMAARRLQGGNKLAFWRR